MKIEERILEVLSHLQVDEFHIGGMMLSDWNGLTSTVADRILSLTLFAVGATDAQLLESMGSKLNLILPGKSARIAEWDKLAKGLKEASVHLFEDYQGLFWEDVIVNFGQEVRSIFDVQIGDGTKGSQDSEDDVRTGIIADITYQVQGAGPNLVLLPLGLTPSQWIPMVGGLTSSYRVIILGGPHLGIIPLLESRGRSKGYRRVISNVLRMANYSTEKTLLDVGCGTGVIDRWIVNEFDGGGQIIGLDINDYLLREANSLAQIEDMEQAINFRKGNAESLPFEDNTFDVTVSFTLLEEVDADRAISEMVRVTKVGGRVVAIVRATDIPWLICLPLPKELKSKIENRGTANEGVSCSSASLYARFLRAGLTELAMMPQLIPFNTPSGGVEQFVEGNVRSFLDDKDYAEWRKAVNKANNDGTYLFCWPHHAAIGTKVYAGSG